METQRKFCRFCSIYMLGHTAPGYLKCTICGYTRLEHPVITKDMVLMGRDTQYPKEYNKEIENNILDLADRVNNLLKDLKINIVSVTSGWRPTEINANVPGASKKSCHQMGKAVDLKDDNNQTICKAIQKKEEESPGYLKKFGLWMEHPDDTKGKFTNWVHLDTSLTRKDRLVRIFRA